MLIEFKVTNFRSVHTTQTLSMVGSTDNALKEQNTFASGLPSLPTLLRSAVIYGPNAAGKSNILRAMQFMRDTVLRSQSRQEGDNINVAPFLLHSKDSEAPSEFEVTFIQDNVRYQYGFAVNKTRVTNEWLLAYPKGKTQRWFERKYNPQKDSDDWAPFSSHFASEPKLRDTCKAATRKNALFLSTAIQLNYEPLKPIFNWFKQRLVFIPAGGIMPFVSLELCESNEDRNRLVKFMKSADVLNEFSDLELIKIPFSPTPAPFDAPKEIKDIIEAINILPRDTEVADIKFLHKMIDCNETVSFGLADESNGTQNLFAFAGPLLNALAKGHILFVDELDSSLHPHLVRFIIGLIQNPAINTNNAQLVFTTHDTSVLDTGIFRRDQVWFVEKDNERASILYPLSDFSPRKDEALEKGYLKGRYGALPFIGEFHFNGK